MTKIKAPEEQEEKVAQEEKPEAEIYVLQGVKNFRCGRWHFQDEMLVLTDKKDIKEFNTFLREAIVTDQYVRRIRRVQGDDESLQAMKAKIVKAAVSGIETSMNRPAQNMREV